MDRDPQLQQQRPVGSRRHNVAAPPPRDGRPPQRRRGFFRRLLSGLLLVAALVLIGGLGWLALSSAGLGGGSSDVEAGIPVRIVVPEGANSNEIAALLADKGIVGRETIFRARLRVNGDGADFRAGSYTIKTGSSYDTIVRTLEKGPAAAPTFDLTLPEGQRMEESAALVDSIRAEQPTGGGPRLPAFTGAEYLTAVRALRPPAGLKAPAGTRSMEGLLFPATFELRHTATAADFVSRQRDSFDENLASINMQRAAEANLTPYDVVIIASLIEREAQLDKERPLVAAVIWNRLQVGEPLGIDASNQYAAYKPGDDVFWTPDLTKSELARDTPYNVRLNAGLPPTPIAAPSLKSLQAAAAPAKVDYRYYVVDPKKTDGSHVFTNDYQEFLNVQQ